MLHGTCLCKLTIRRGAVTANKDFSELIHNYGLWRITRPLGLNPPMPGSVLNFCLLSQRYLGTSHLDCLQPFLLYQTQALEVEMGWEQITQLPSLAGNAFYCIP